MAKLNSLRVYQWTDGTFRFTGRPNIVYKNPVSAIADASREQKKLEKELKAIDERPKSVTSRFGKIIDGKKYALSYAWVDKKEAERLSKSFRDNDIPVKIIKEKQGGKTVYSVYTSASPKTLWDKQSTSDKRKVMRDWGMDIDDINAYDTSSFDELRGDIKENWRRQVR